jgi:metacaspase-1
LLGDVWYLVGNVANFRLPDPAGRAGGACTSTLLSIVYRDHEDTSGEMTYKEVIDGMRGALDESNYTQIPQVSCQSNGFPFHPSCVPKI